MKDITDAVNDVCMVRQRNVLHDAVTSLPNELQLRLHVITVPACSIQIRAHYHIDVYADINQTVGVFGSKARI